MINFELKFGRKFLDFSFFYQIVSNLLIFLELEIKSFIIKRILIYFYVTLNPDYRKTIFERNVTFLFLFFENIVAWHVTLNTPVSFSAEFQAY